ncbi:hypothetical protein D3C76_1110230 [compost metagenome]
MSLMIGFCALTSVWVINNAEFLIQWILGDQWAGLNDIMYLLAISASLAALVNISDMFVRALGNPKWVTILTYVQVFMYIGILFIVGHLTVHTLILASIISLLMTNSLLLGYIIYRAHGSIMVEMLKSCFITVALSAALFGMSFIIHNPLLHIILSFIVYIVFLILEYRLSARSHTESKDSERISDVAMQWADS